MALSASIFKFFLFTALFYSGLSHGLTPDAARAKMNSHVVGKVDMWKTRLKRPLFRRVSGASSLVIEYLTLSQAAVGQPPPKSAKFGNTFNRVSKRSLKSLPQKIKRLLNRRLAGIFAVKGLGKISHQEPIRDARGKVVAVMILIDVDRIVETPNEWATKKEASLFQPGEYSVQVRLASATDNKAQETIKSVLLYEIGHLFAQFTDHLKDSPFQAAALPAGLKLQTGGNPNSKMPQAYEWLEKSSYPSLSAARSAEEDFAESFAAWARIKRLNRPYSLSVYLGQSLVKMYVSCFVGTRCQDKAAVFEKLWPNQGAKTGQAKKKKKRRGSRKGKPAAKSNPPKPQESQ